MTSVVVTKMAADFEYPTILKINEISSSYKNCDRFRNGSEIPGTFDIKIAAGLFCVLKLAIFLCTLQCTVLGICSI